MNKLIRLTAALIALTWASSALAVPTFHLNRATWEVAAGLGVVTEDFEGSNVAPGGALACDAPLSSAGNGCYNPGEIIGGVTFSEQPPRGANALVVVGDGFLGASTTMFGPNFLVDGLDIWFDTVVDAAGFDFFAILGTSPNDFVISLFGADGLLTTLNIGITSDIRFFGYAGLNVLHINLSAPGATAEIIDNLSIRVPEPGTLALLGLGLIGLGFSRRRT